MPSKSGRDDEVFVKLFVSAYENLAWKNSHICWLDQKQDGAVEALVTRPDEETMAIEHTLIEPFVGDKSDFAAFDRSLAALRNDQSLAVPNAGIEVYIPAGTMDGQKPAKREKIWGSRSRLHVNTDFRFNSQSLTFCLTPHPSLGGRAWPTFKMADEPHEIIASLWANSTFGLLTYWWSANKAQDGRGSITTTQIPKFYILDPRKLSNATLQKSDIFYSLTKAKSLFPAHQLANDPVRAEIDTFVLKELLKIDTLSLPPILDMMAKLREKLGSEPSFNGGK